MRSKNRQILDCTKNKNYYISIRIKYLKTDNLGDSLIHRPKDQSKFLNKLIFEIESNFPSIFYWMKNRAIKSLFK